MNEVQSTRVIIPPLNYDYNDPAAFSKAVGNSIETTLTDNTIVWMYDVLNTVTGPNISMRVTVPIKNYDHSDTKASSELIGTDGKFTLNDGTTIWVYGFSQQAQSGSRFKGYALRSSSRT